MYSKKEKIYHVNVRIPLNLHRNAAVALDERNLNFQKFFIDALTQLVTDGEKHE